MPSSFPNGFTSQLLVRGLPLTVMHPGKVWFVNNSSVLAEGGIAGSNSNNGTYRKPFQTIDYAIGRCVASRGDIIMVMPGHVENITAAAGVVADVAGIAIVGLGTGSLRPKIRFSTAATADMDITANNISFVNIDFNANFADVTAAIDVSGVTGLTFQNCYFTEAAANLNFVDVLDFATGATDIVFDNVRFLGNDAANDSFITGVDFDGLVIRDSYISEKTAQAAAVGLIETSGNAVNVDIRDTSFVSFVDGANFIDFNGANNSGTVTNCYFSSNDAAGAVTAGFDFTGGHIFECYVAGDADSYGIIGGGTAYGNT